MIADLLLAAVSGVAGSWLTLWYQDHLSDKELLRELHQSLCRVAASCDQPPARQTHYTKVVRPDARAEAKFICREAYRLRGGRHEYMVAQAVALAVVYLNGSGAAVSRDKMRQVTKAFANTLASGLLHKVNHLEAMKFGQKPQAAVDQDYERS
jgi:hypothetical protein